MSRWRRIGRVALGSLVALGIAAAIGGAWFRSRRPELPAKRAEPRSLSHAGLERSYRLYVAASYDAEKPGTVVFVLHGALGTAEEVELLTLGRFNELAERDGGIVVYPDGVDKYWNDGRTLDDRAHKENIDDVGFLSAVTDELVDDYDIDTAKVFAVGMSNGGFMCLRLACDASQTFAAVGSVAGGLAQNVVDECRPERAISVLLVHGTDDEIVPMDETTVQIMRRARGHKLTIEATVQLFTQHDGCGPPVESELDPVDEDDDSRVRRTRHAGCQDDSEVVLYTVEGGGHTWPGGWQYLPETLVGKTSRQIDTSELAWNFFARHARR